MKLDKLIHEAERLPAAENWRLVKQLLRSLEAEQPPAVFVDSARDYHRQSATLQQSLVLLALSP